MTASGGQGNGTYPSRSRRKPRHGLGTRRRWFRPFGIGALVVLALVLGFVGHSLGTRNAPVAEPVVDPAASPTSSAAVPSVAGTPGTGSASTSARSSSSPQSSGGDSGKTTTTADSNLTVPRSGPRTYREAHVSAKARGSKGRLIRYDVRVEKGVPVKADDAAEFIAATLNDKRSWVGRGKWRFQLVSKASEAELHAYIATPGTTDKLCAPLRTQGKVSCQNGNKVVLNAERWVHGAASYGDHLTDYRHSLVNHEFGHYLGFGHVGCPGKGKRAPVMMQQTKGLDGCRRNPWPDPDR